MTWDKYSVIGLLKIQPRMCQISWQIFHVGHVVLSEEMSECCWWLNWSCFYLNQCLWWIHNNDTCVLFGIAACRTWKGFCRASSWHIKPCKILGIVLSSGRKNCTFYKRQLYFNYSVQLCAWPGLWESEHQGHFILCQFNSTYWFHLKYLAKYSLSL